MGIQHYGIAQAKDRGYGLASALSYWVFKCRDKNKSPAMGTKTWTFFENSIQNSAEISICIEDYLQRLSVALVSHLRPNVLSGIVKPTQRIMRVNVDLTEIQEIEVDQDLVFVGWHDLLNDALRDGYTEWDILDLCRNRAAIIQVLCRLRFEEDRAIGQESNDDFVEVESQNV